MQLRNVRLYGPRARGERAGELSRGQSARLSRAQPARHALSSFAYPASTNSSRLARTLRSGWSCFGPNVAGELWSASVGGICKCGSTAAAPRSTRIVARSTAVHRYRDVRCPQLPCSKGEEEAGRLRSRIALHAPRSATELRRVAAFDPCTRSSRPRGLLGLAAPDAHPARARGEPAVLLIADDHSTSTSTPPLPPKPLRLRHELRQSGFRHPPRPRQTPRPLLAPSCPSARLSTASSPILSTLRQSALVLPPATIRSAHEPAPRYRHSQSRRAQLVHRARPGVVAHPLGAGCPERRLVGEVVVARSSSVIIERTTHR